MALLTARTVATLLVLLASCTVHEYGAPAREAPSADAPVVLFFGDSITAGTGVGQAAAFPAVVQERINSEGLDYRCVNAGVSGITTGGSLLRLPEFLREPPAVVVVELGANDVFRRVPSEAWTKNLVEIVERFQAAGSGVLIAGTLFPPFELRSGGAAEAVYRDVARLSSAPLLVDLMAGVAGDPALNVADGVHPNLEGHRRLAETLWPYLLPLLD
ncbi:MAG TPA: arylesterase [Deltaproteobacteria bacterium]|nr:arylesterase [Candidatus Binatota bacterium]HIL13365.1 arylesterase [Deltaproteobacteria bacterium]